MHHLAVICISPISVRIHVSAGVAAGVGRIYCFYLWRIVALLGLSEHMAMLHQNLDARVLML